MLSSFQFINNVFNPIAVDMALSIALSKNVMRSHEFDIHREIRDIGVEEKRETEFLHAQIENEAEITSRARAQAEGVSQASRKVEAEMQAEVHIKIQEEKEQNPAQRQDLKRRYCRSRQARSRRAQAQRFRGTGHEQGQRKGIGAVHHPVGCATIPPESAVPLFHYFRHIPLSSSPSPSPSPSRLPPFSSLSSPTPSPLLSSKTPSLNPSRNANAEQTTQVGPRERAEQLQELYKSESAVHAHATALARGIRGVQPHRRVYIAGVAKRDNKDNGTSPAATIASTAASRSGNEFSNDGTAPAAGSRKLNAAAAPFVSSQNDENQVAGIQDTKNGMVFTDLHHGQSMPLSDRWTSYIGCYTYQSAWEQFQASDSFHDITKTFSSNSEDIYDNKTDFELTTQVHPRSRTNPFPISSALSSFTPSLAALSPLESSQPSPDSTKSPTSKESLSSFLAEEGDLLDLQLAHALRRQHAEAELELTLAQKIRQQPRKPQKQQYEKIGETFMVVIKDSMRAVSEEIDGTIAERWSVTLSPSSNLAAEKVVGRTTVEVEAEARKERGAEHKEEEEEEEDSDGEFMLPPPALPLSSSVEE